MNLLLDTHALLWRLGGEPMESVATRRIADPETLVTVSAATVWEIAIKRAHGKLRMKGSLLKHLQEGGFERLPISLEHAERAGSLPPHHRDPFDRMLIAQAMAEKLTLVTRDPVFEFYDVRLLRC